MLFAEKYEVVGYLKKEN